MEPLTGSTALRPDVMIPTAWSTAIRAVVRMPSVFEARALVQRVFYVPLFAVLILQLGNAIVELVEVGETVDQTGALGGVGRERAVVEQRAHLLDALSSCFGDPCTSCSYEIAIERLEHLAVRGREILSG